MKLGRDVAPYKNETHFDVAMEIDIDPFHRHDHFCTC